MNDAITNNGLPWSFDIAADFPETKSATMDLQTNYYYQSYKLIDIHSLIHLKLAILI